MCWQPLRCSGSSAATLHLAHALQLQSFQAIAWFDYELQTPHLQRNNNIKALISLLQHIHVCCAITLTCGMFQQYWG